MSDSVLSDAPALAPRACASASSLKKTDMHFQFKSTLFVRLAA
jgi:hypothetical protein